MSVLRTAMLDSVASPARQSTRYPRCLDQQSFSPQKNELNMRTLRRIQQYHEELLNQNKRDSEVKQYSKYIAEMHEAQYERELKYHTHVALASKWRKPNALLKYEFSGRRPIIYYYY